MDAQTIYQIILDQREDIAVYMDDKLVIRSEAAQIDFDSKLAQVVIGVRRSGKSTLCHMALLSQKLTYGYVNFDDDRLANVTVDDLNTVLEAVYRVYGVDIHHLLLDEVQNVEGWHLFVNRLLRQGMHVFVTGSNAKLLSSELSTHLTGRYHEIRLYPFSFRDYCLANHVPLDLPTTKNVSLQQNALQQYLIEGGFPEVSGIKDRHGYVEGVVHAIIHKDIKTRFRLRNANGLYLLAQHLMNNVGQLVNVKELSEKLGVGSNKTVRNYIDYLSQAFLIIPLHKYSWFIRHFE
jgi:predicted AAA+ superfamily ATPase